MNRVAGEVPAQNNIIRNGRISDMRIIKTKDYNDMSRKAANYIGALIINKPDCVLGLATGSIPMVGGHGTAGSFGPLLEELGVANASVVAIASATYGLVAGCVIGGPIATAKIRKYKLSAVTEAATKTETVETDETGAIDSARILDGLLYLIVAIGAGTIVSMFLGKFMTFPFYIGAM